MAKKDINVYFGGYDKNDIYEMKKDKYGVQYITDTEIIDSLIADERIDDLFAIITNGIKKVTDEGYYCDDSLYELTRFCLSKIISSVEDKTINYLLKAALESLK